MSKQLRFMSYEILTTLSNVLYILIPLIVVFYCFIYFKKRKEQKKKNEIKETDIYKEQMRKDRLNKNTGPISNYLTLLEEFFSKKKAKSPNLCVSITILIILFVSIFIAVKTSVSLGVITFFIITLLISVILKNINESDTSESEYKLPEVIEVMIRCFSKNDELQVVLYETSLNIDEPFKTMFSNIAREMTSTGHIIVLKKYCNNTNSIWINSLFSTLIKYKEDVKKEDTIDNLKYLRDMITQDNELKRKLISEKRYNVVLNYILSAVAIVINIVLFIVFPDIAKRTYFSSPFGTLMLITGYACVFAVILLTKKLGNQNTYKIKE